MAHSSVHFEPTTQGFGNLTLHAMTTTTDRQNRFGAWKMASARQPVSVNLLIGLAFILAFLTALSGLYLMDQAVFSSASSTASAQNTAYNGAMIDYD